MACVAPTLLFKVVPPLFPPNARKHTGDGGQNTEFPRNTEISFLLSFLSGVPVSISSPLEKFSIECRKWSEISWVLLYFALWLVPKTRAALNQSGAKLKPLTTMPLAFSDAAHNLVVPIWVLLGSSGYFSFRYDYYDARSNSALSCKVACSW